MNKQVVIAGILGAAAAQTACDGPFVKAAKEAQQELEAGKVEIESYTAPLVAAAAAEKTVFDAAQVRVDDQATLIAPFQTKLTENTAAHKLKADAVAAATAEITALGTKITAADTALTAANTLVTNKNTEIAAQRAIMVKLDAAVTEHTTGEALMQAALTAATAAVSVATGEKTTAETAVTTYTDGAKAAADSKKSTVDTTKGTADTTAATDNTAMTTGTGGWDTYKVTLEAKDKWALWKVIFTSGCNTTCATQANDPIRALFDNATTQDGTANTAEASAKTTYDTKKDTAMASKAAAKKAELEAEVALADVNTADNALIGLNGTVTTKTAALTTATSAETTATTNKTTATSQKTQAITDQTRGNALLTTLQGELTPLTDDVTVKTYLKRVQTDLLATEEAAKIAANLNIADLDTLKTMAQETVTRAQATATFYAGLLTSATASKLQADNMVTDNANKIVAVTAKIEAMKLELASYISECKEAGYAEAQDALKAQIDKTAADAAAAAAVKSDYEAKAAFSDTGETNTICAYPTKAKDAAQEPRPPCKDGYCCGAAQKFLKDGTKLSIETCQKAEGVHTYQYYPPLPTGAAVEPTPETWRFQCISGAQKLVATATAALAASYMMA